MQYEKMTEDNLRREMEKIRDEFERRNTEKKKPVFIVDGNAFKHLPAALNELIGRIKKARDYEAGPEEYLQYYIQENKTAFGMRIEHWSLSEYNSRPDIVMLGGDYFD